MVRICIVTATRAEYGLLRPVIKGMMNDPDFEVSLVVTGMHLSPEFGLTYREIENDGIPISKKIDILLSADSPSAISKSMGLALISFGEYFSENNFDMVLLLGDRYETLAVACAAVNARIPIAHMHGGEITEGAVDDAFRHAITKMSYLHFTSTEAYRKRVIQMGENPDRVFNVGSTGIENIENVDLLSRDELSQELGMNLSKDYAVVTFHPVTLENYTAEEQINELLEAIDEFSDMSFIITKANADQNGRIINSILEKYAEDHINARVYDSLGMRRYLSALKYASMVIGNSSSGIIEAPSFRIPTVNIGDRQKGRVRADSVIDCKPQKLDIIKAMKEAVKMTESGKLYNVQNPYRGVYKTKTSKIIISTIKDFAQNNRIDLKKIFYDLDAK